MTLSSVSTNVPISFNRKYNELTTSHLQIEALTPHGTTTMDKPGHVPFVIMYNPALRFFSSIIRKKIHILISSPVVITSFKAVPIATYRRTSNLSDFLVRAKIRGSYLPRLIPTWKKLFYLQILHIWRTNFIQISLYT